jgi:hypothetical protein
MALSGLGNSIVRDVPIQPSMKELKCCWLNFLANFLANSL